jgi:tryptophanyl-tRNA synthetase
LATTPNTTTKKRVLSGMRPTGKLHIGHYFGALENWVSLQNEEAPVAPSGPAVSAGSSAPSAEESSASSIRPYECFYFIADWHALTSDYADTSAVAQNTIEIVTDYLAAGLDPQKSVIFQQSLVPEHAELNLLLGMVTPLGDLERVPTYKEQLENVSDKDLHTFGFLGYPVLQTADIVMYGEEGSDLLVPVGEDQESHVELSRRIVQIFNFHFGLQFASSALAKVPENIRERVLTKLGILHTRAFNLLDLEIAAHKRSKKIGHQNFLEEMGEDAPLFKLRSILEPPQVMLTKTPRIPGLDGRKMSKSYGNAITLSESDDDIRKKTKVMVTDPARKRRTDPGNPDVCPVYDWHKLFSTAERDAGRLEWVRTGCTTAGIGCIECKAAMAENLITWIAPIRERRMKWENNQRGVLEVIDEGSKRARTVAQGTMHRVREAVFAWTKKRSEVAAGK